VRHGDLVYAKLTGTPAAPKVEFIVPVAIPRVGYDRKIAMLLPRHLWKCDSFDELCPACRTFGWVYGRGSENPEDLPPYKLTAYAGRLRFSHAELLDEEPRTYDPITLAILSSPKPTTTRFYLKPVDSKPKRGLDNYQSGYDNKDNVLRGRKVYRHHGHGGDDSYWSQPEREHVSVVGKSEQNRTIQDAVQPGSRFEFTIDFDNLSEVELGALLWSLEMGGSSFHRLGLAKPLGFGSVKLKVVKMSLLDTAGRYGVDFAKGWTEVSSDQRNRLVDTFKLAMRHAYGSDFDDLPHVKDLLTLLNDPSTDLPIHYPRPDKKLSEEGKSYEWFVGNNRKPNARLVLELPGEENGLPLTNRFGEVSE